MANETKIMSYFCISELKWSLPQQKLLKILMEHTQCWHACWNQTIIVAKNKIQYLNFRYPVHQSLSEQMWLERLQTADCQEEMFDAFDIAGTQSTLFRSGTEKLPEDCGTWQNIQHLHIQKKFWNKCHNWQVQCPTNLHSPMRKSLSTVHRLASNDLRHDVHTRP